MPASTDMPSTRPLRVLVVDDERINRVVMEAMLRKMGHEAILASSGNEAITLLHQLHPDLVLMDVMMPSMSGYDATRAIRTSADGQMPIIFLTALEKPEDIIEGLHAGADDYLHKPVNYELLNAKINTLHERQRLLSLLSRQNKELGEYQAHAEDDRNVAVRFMERLSALERITDPAVKFHLMQAKDFGGDLIAAARAPNGCLHIMLADSAGHGLSAALSIMPVVEPFYKMTAKGFDILGIVEEMNKRVRKYVSLPRYVAANVISIDTRERTIRAWNGGCPQGLVLQTNGEVLHRFTSRHLPLGVLNEHEFDSSIEHYDYGDKQCRVCMCSDGVTELGLEEGRALDLEGILQRSHAEPNYFEHLVQTITTELHGQPVLDDIAMVCADCAVHSYPQSVSRQDAKTSEAQQDSVVEIEDSADQVTWKLDITLTAAQLKHLDVVPMLTNITSTIEAGQADAAIFMVLSELFNNALDHGVLKLDSGLKQHEDGMGRYYDERTARLAGLTEGQIEIGMERIKSNYGDWLKLRMSDSGNGFDYAAINQGGVVEHQRHGRGLSLLYGLCDILEYGGNGSEVVAYLDLDTSTG
jgi:CheY-like chemotaxis protein